MDTKQQQKLNTTINLNKSIYVPAITWIKMHYELCNCFLGKRSFPNESIKLNNKVDN